METVTALLMGVGGLLAILSLLLGIGELVTLHKIRPPERRTFTYIRLAENQHRTIIAPALGALISGLFVSLSASFFYDAFVHPDHSWRQYAGLVTFILGGVALVFTLRSVLTGVGEPSELARDPFTIRAAAEEYAANPRHGELDPVALTRQLEDWRGYISARSLNLTAKARSKRLDRVLTRGCRTHTFWPSVWSSLHVYRAAICRFPFRFGWPVLGWGAFIGGALWYASGVAKLDFIGSWRPWATMALFVIGGAVPFLFYCAARGNRARLWHRINVTALDEAWVAIETAKSAKASADAEDALFRKVLDDADRFLNQAESVPGARTVFRVGRLRLSIETASTVSPRE